MALSSVLWRKLFHGQEGDVKFISLKDILWKVISWGNAGGDYFPKISQREINVISANVGLW